MILIILDLLLLSGCWDSQDIQDKSIHITQLVDYRDGNYVLYGEIEDLSAPSQENGTRGPIKVSVFMLSWQREKL